MQAADRKLFLLWFTGHLKGEVFARAFNTNTEGHIGSGYVLQIKDEPDLLS